MSTQSVVFTYVVEQSTLPNLLVCTYCCVPILTVKYYCVRPTRIFSTRDQTDDDKISEVPSRSDQIAELNIVLLFVSLFALLLPNYYCTTRVRYYK